MKTMKSSIKTIRDHKERLSKVVLHIQNNLDKSLTIEQLATIACFSPYHFHRLFTAYYGEPLNAFIRRNRLERAALLLCHSNFSDENITSIAFGAGYETPAAFSKAFKQHFRKTPKEFKAERNNMCRQYKTHIETSKVGVKVAPYTIDDFREQYVLFSRITGAYNRTSKKNWNVLLEYANGKGIDHKDVTLFGIPHDCSSITQSANRRYDFCLILNRDIKPEGEVGVQLLEGGKYAVFSHQGALDNITGTYREIFYNWFPGSGEKLRNAPCLEIFSRHPTLNTVHKDSGVEVCIPLQ